MRGMEFDLDQVLNPAAVFNHPRDVLNDPDLTKQEKRAILSSWASDACAAEDPEFRQPSGAAPVKFDDIMDALLVLDTELERRVGPTQSTGRRSSPQESGEGAPL